jgi:glycosyltransferase involved in cell wall biosynthesis
MSGQNILRHRHKPLTVCLDLSPQLGGLARGIVDLAAAVEGPVISLDSRRHSDPEPPPTDGLVRIPVPEIRLLSATGRLPRRVDRLLQEAIGLASVVVIHSLYRPHVPAIARICRARLVPYWVVTHGMLDPWVTSRQRLTKWAWLRWFGRPALHDARIVLFSTPAERDKARPAYAGLNSAVVPWPVDVPDLHDRPTARAALRTSLGLPADANVLLWMARYDSLKRPEHVIEAFTAAAVPGWSLVMAGFPGDVPLDRMRTAAAESSARIVVQGPATGEDKRMLLLGSDAFLSLSWRENFGYALADALATGLPIAVSPDHDLVSIDLRCDFCVSAADHSLTAAVAAIQRVCRLTPENRRSIEARSRAWVAAELDRTVFASRLTSLIQRTPDVRQGDDHGFRKAEIVQEV